MPVADYLPILNGFADPAFLVDSRRRLQGANVAALAVFGRIAAETGLDFVHVMRRPEVLRLLDAVIAGRDVAQETLQLDNALRGLYRVTAARIGAEGAVISFADLSHIHEAEQMRSDFVANVSHELRSPLTALSGFIETLQGPAANDPAAQARFLELMAGEAARMNRLISDLLSLSKLETEERRRPTTRVDLGAVVARVIATLGPVTERERVAIAFDPPAGALVAGDEDQLTQVAQNLIENAIKYGGRDQTVEVSVARRAGIAGFAGDCVVLEVRDHGPGVAAAHIPRLTERFYRVDAGRSRDKGGTGLGLAIVKHIVQRHRGRLLIDSAPGEGARFRVALPAAE